MNLSAYEMTGLGLSMMVPHGWVVIWYPSSLTPDGGVFTAWRQREGVRFSVFISWRELGRLRSPAEIVDYLERCFVWPLRWMEEVQI